MLVQKWPAKFNSAGHHTFSGRLYGRGLTQLFFRKARIHYGSGGFAPFQSLYERAPGVLGSLPLMPEWYFLVSILICITLLGIVSKPLLIAAPLVIAAISLSVMNAAAGAFNASFHAPPRSGFERVWRRCLTGLLHLIQPLARLSGRLLFINSRRPVVPHFVFPHKRSFATWSTDWQDPKERLSELKRRLRPGSLVVQGGTYDSWDVEVFGGMLGSARMLMAVEDHGAGSQLVRVRSWPRLRSGAMILTAVLGCLVLLTACNGEWIIGGAFGAMLVVFLWTAMRQAGRATALLIEAFGSTTNQSASNSSGHLS
jgi:hypothetical protein